MISKIKCLIYISIFAANLIFAQNLVKSTTQEEYNYMKNGYKVQLEQGLDMKKGYSINNNLSKNITVKSYEFGFKHLERSDKTFAGYIVKAVSKTWGNTYWYCIPNSNDLLEQFMKQMSTLDLQMSVSFVKAFLQFQVELNSNLTPTTTEEYNYISKGLATMVSQGLDMKKGYKIYNEKTTKCVVDDSNQFDYTPLIREKDNSVAGIIVKYNNKKDKFYCIPNQVGAEFDSLYQEIYLFEYRKLIAFFKANIMYYNRIK